MTGNVARNAWGVWLGSGQSIGEADELGRKRYAVVDIDGEQVDALLWEKSFQKFPEKFSAGQRATVQICVEPGDYYLTCQLALPKIRRASEALVTKFAGILENAE